MKVCQGHHTQNVWNVDAMTTLRLAPEDLQFLLESIRVMITPSVPMMPPPELEGEKTLEMRVFKAATGEVCAPVAHYRYIRLYILL